MVSLPGFPAGFPSAEVDDHQRAPARLAALRDAPGQARPVPDPAEPRPAGTAEPRPAGTDEPRPAGTGEPSGPVTPLRAGRLVRRWVPAPLREARWEPGRSGALMLSLVAALAAVLAAVGVWRDRPVPVPAPPLPLLTPAESAAPPPPATPPEVVISVVGKVARPGLVRVPDGSRVADALAAAGGALPGIDLVALNLARRVADGEQVLVGVVPPPGAAMDGAAPPAAAAGAPAAASPLVDLNTATLEQLDTLPGVGPVTAQRIVDWRSAHGRFTSVDQLREVSGIGEARFARLKDLVRI